MQALVECPGCGESIELWIDAGGGPAQRYVEDCAVCCRPFEVTVRADDDGEPAVSIRRLDA